MQTQEHQVCFHTGTTIDPRSWEIIGMSAKETDNPIGQFGSGLKFAIAILLRTGHEVEIHSGGEVHKFGSKAQFFRGQEFDIVTCNDKELGMTTQLGKHWELWMAYRELVCNTMDEGGLHFRGGPMPDGTSIVVTGEKFAGLLSRHEEFFVGDREPITEFGQVRVYKGSGTIFYRGVRVGRLDKARYAYEFLGQAKLTEDRTLLDQNGLVAALMMNLVQTCENKSFIKELITLPETYWEHHQDYDWTWSADFTEAVGEIYATAPTKLNPSVRRCAPKRLGHKEWTEIDMDERQTAMLDQAKKFLDTIGYPVTARVALVDYRDTSGIGFVDGNDIYLGKAAFARGMIGLVTALLRHTIKSSLNGASFETFLLGELLEKSCALHKTYL